MFHDDFKPQKLNSSKFKKLKGHVKLTLKNAKTGETEKVIEGDNIVTNALPDILDKNNYFGCVDYNILTPLWSKWFGGCILYENPFPVDEVTEEIDPNDYWIKNNSFNKLIGHAGDQVTSDIGDDPTRGMPNTYLRVKNPNSLTMAWEFGPTQALGEISSIALCHKDVGNSGTGKNSNAFRAFQPFEIINRSNLGSISGNNYYQDHNISGQLDDHWAFFYYVGQHGQENTQFTGGQYDKHSITIHFKRTCFDEVGLQDTNYAKDNSWVTSTYSGFEWSGPPAYSWDKTNKTLWLFRCDATGWVQYGKFVFTKQADGTWYTNWTYDYFYYEESDDLAAFNNIINFYTLPRMGVQIPHQQKVVEGVTQDVFYFPRSDGNSWLKFNIQNQADKEIIQFNAGPGSGVGGSHQRTGSNGLDSEALIVLPSHVVNSGIGYPCTVQFPIVTDWAEWWNMSTGNIDLYCSGFIFAQPNEPSTFIYPLASRTSTCPNSTPRWIAVNKLVHTTMFNLSESVMKTTAQTMILEYTLTEVDEDGES